VAEEDTYGSKRKFHLLVQDYKLLALSRAERVQKLGQRRSGKYGVLNKRNLVYFPLLFDYCDLHDLSYQRRNKLASQLKFVLATTERFLGDIEEKGDRTEINRVIAQAKRSMGPRSASDLVKDLKLLWNQFFPAKDEKGREDETQTPYVVRHLSDRIDPSKKRPREDRLTIDEYLRILEAFNHDPRTQFFIALIYESLGRPQAVLNLRMRDVKLFEQYAEIRAPKGKEGPQLLQCIDSYSYLFKLLASHPRRNDPDAPLFMNLGSNKRFDRMTPPNMNKKIRECCIRLGIQKKITCYSFKRNGVSNLRLDGVSDKSIQARAGWVNTRQLQTYDLAGQDEAYLQRLIQEGIVKPDEKTKIFAPTKKKCMFCGHVNGVSDRNCYNCTRLLSREDIEAEAKRHDEELDGMRQQLAFVQMGLQELQSIKQLKKKVKRPYTVLEHANVTKTMTPYEKALEVGNTVSSFNQMVGQLEEETYRTEIREYARLNKISETQAERDLRDLDAQLASSKKR